MPGCFLLKAFGALECFLRGLAPRRRLPLHGRAFLFLELRLFLLRDGWATLLFFFAGGLRLVLRERALLAFFFLLLFLRRGCLATLKAEEEAA